MQLRWWGQLAGGTELSAPVLPLTNSVGVVNYYVDQVDLNGSGCSSSPRQLVTVTVNPNAPDVTGNTTTYC
jgi:hypothetical protein